MNVFLVNTVFLNFEKNDKIGRRVTKKGNVTVRISIPRNLNGTTVTKFYSDTINTIVYFEPHEVNFDFNNLDFIRPAGIVTLTNMIELIKHDYPQIHITYTCPKDYRIRPRDFPVVDFLDDSLFFKKVMGEKLHPGSNERETTNGLEMLKKDYFNQEYIDKTIAWLRRNVSLRKKSFSFLSTALGELFNNINDHSGSSVGGSVFAQHYPRDNEINLCIADSGLGIANRMKTKFKVDHEGNALDTDAKLINFATYGRVSTKTKPGNRGLGLDNLIHIIKNNKGGMKILSNNGELSYDVNRGIEFNVSSGFYSGTLILLSFRTDTLDEDEEEEFVW